MSFTQTSQKFGQWSDVRANTVYGLGFASEAELTKFVEKFQEVKEATKNALAKTAANGRSIEAYDHYFPNNLIHVYRELSSYSGHVSEHISHFRSNSRISE